MDDPGVWWQSEKVADGGQSDNRSESLAPLEIAVRREELDYVIEVHGAIAIANTLAYLSEMAAQSASSSA